MEIELRVSEAASIDLERMRDWLTQPGAGANAEARREAIIKAVEDLAIEPQRWRDGDEPGTQECVVAGYTIVYRANYKGSGRVGATEVEILRVFGPGQLRTRS